MARVLMVEDDSRLALSMRIRLEALGHQVLWAGDGCEALAVAESQVVELIFLDLSLPKLDGIQVAKRLLGSDDPELPPIVLVTGSRPEDYPGEESLFERLQVLRKPYTSEELSRCLHGALVQRDGAA